MPLVASSQDYYGHCFNDLIRRPSSLLKNERCRKLNLSRVFRRSLDRVNVLGDETAPAHTGCVNALSWVRDGELLLSGGDDTTVRVWEIDNANALERYPFTCRSVVQTGHRANIFGVQMLPFSTRIATVAGDKQVRVFDIGEDGLSGSQNECETSFNSRQSCIRILRCHEDRVKRVVTECSPDIFLTVSEDGSVRQHDLRSNHHCQREPCPVPLAKVNHELSTLALSPLTPYQFVVAGESPFGYLFDRRQSGRILQEEWGAVPETGRRDSPTNCILRFGRPKKGVGNQDTNYDHITGARMSNSNGHEVLLSYSTDAVYLYSIFDDIVIKDSMSSPSSILQCTESKEGDAESVASQPKMDCVCRSSMSSLELEYSTDNTLLTKNRIQTDKSDIKEEPHMFLPGVPVIYPRQRYAGARNSATVKDVNFFGPCEQLVASGSDDGNFFIWDKVDGTIHGIYEGDGNIVNVIESHPHLPLVAVSGIDTSIKLFAPTASTSGFSRTENASQIVKINAMTRRPAFPTRGIAALLLENGLGGAVVSECPTQ